MAGERRKTTFQQLLEDGLLEIGDGYRAQNNELGGTGPIFLRAGHVTDSHIDFNEVEHFHEHLADKVRSKMSKIGDTIVTTKGNSTGRTSFVTDLLPPFVYSPHLSYWRSRDIEKLCGGFLRYWARGAEFINQLSGMKASTDMAPYLSLTDQRRLSITLPPFAEQKTIAAVLGSLDDKIDLNRRMNVTLEGMARALFESWFVDFDPVRAKLDGRSPTAIDAATAALFPEHLEDSSLGHIPEGWGAGTLGDSFDLTMGQSPPGDTYNEAGVGLPFYQGRSDFGFRFPSRRIYCSTPTRYANSGDTLVSVRAPVGDINMASEECCIGRGVAAVRHKSGATSFTYHSMANLFPEFARFEAEGTVFGSINKDSFEKLPFVIPPSEIVAAFERQVGPIDDQIRTLENQRHTLGTLRDTLLPKLLRGELRLDSNWVSYASNPSAHGATSA
jgi:type I restriction enzyme, S subunit